ncbi:MAG: hypothetical protein ACOYB1_11130 [Limnohabitans sp.]
MSAIRGLANAGLLVVGLLCGLSLHAASPQAGTRISVQAKASYVPNGFTQVETAVSNTVIAEILPVEALVLSGDDWVARAPGTHTTLVYRLVNAGNVSSTISTAVSNAANCSAQVDTTDLSNLRVVVDANSNGIADPAELAASPDLVLPAGQSVSLLVVGDVPMSNGGGACIQLRARTALQSVVRAVSTFVSIADNPVLQLSKTALYIQALQRGTSDIATYSLTASNTGTRPATVTDTAAGGALITVNGSPVKVVLLRDLLPVGAQYKMGSLMASHANALKLFRLPGDAAFNYRTVEDTLATEVAVALPQSLDIGQSLGMRFNVSALQNAGTSLDNVGQIHFGNVAGVTGASAIQSNTAQVPVAGERLGLALSVASKKFNLGPDYQPDGTVTYTLALRVRNAGDAPLFNLKLPHLLAGEASTSFGSYTSMAVPGPGQYTVVPGSLQVMDRLDSTTVVPLNDMFTGYGTATDLLTTGTVLPLGGEFTLRYAVRANVTARADKTILTQVLGQGSLHAYTRGVDTSDLSTHGSNPDPDGDGHPGNNSVPTPITFPNVENYSRDFQGLIIEKIASKPVRVAQGIYDQTYLINVLNKGLLEAPFVRVLDNLACAFNPQVLANNIASWTLISGPVSKNGLLPVSKAFTGDATCDADSQNSADPTVMPSDPRLILNDGSRSLLPGQTEQLSFTVRVTQRDRGLVSRISNKAWVAAVEENSFTAPTVIVAKAAAVTSLLVDPQGYVYDSVTRQPLGGVVVTLRRQSCDSSALTAIVADEVFDGSNGQYTYNSDGSISMTTGADGQYQFYWRVPPVRDVCTYSLTATPGASSGYVPSTLFKAESGTYAQCAMVVPDSAIPIGQASTAWYSQIRTGYNSAVTPASCEALHNNIPLDPANVGTAMLLRKQANKSQAEMGDFVDYQLSLSNRSGVSVGNITFGDILPPGFAYVPGSAWLNDSTRLADPVAGSDSATRRSSLKFNLTGVSLADKASLTVRYRLRVGVGATNESDAINTAQASVQTLLTGLTLPSNTAQAKVRVSGGVLSTQGFAIGKVYADCNANGQQDGPEEPGLPGVRLYMEDGTSVITDNFGRWSLYGLKPVTHVLRVDRSTLPAGVTLAVLDNRNAGVADSRFLDIKNGELVRADFVTHSCNKPEVLQDIERRRELFAKSVDLQLQALVSARLGTEARVAVSGDVRALAASGSATPGAAIGVGAVLPDSQSQPLISLPARMGPVIGQGTGLMGNANAPMQSASANGPTALTQALLGAVFEPSSQSLEEVIERLPAQAAFVELRDGHTVATGQINVRVTGPQQSSLRLLLNGVAVPDSRIGKKAKVTTTGLVACEFIGVELSPGVNTVRLEALDEFGNVRQSEQIRLTAPAGLGRFRFEPQGRLVADPLRAATIRLHLSDAAGVPIRVRTAVTLEAQGAQWLNEDLDPAQPGVQLFVEGGFADLQMLPPANQGVVNVRASSGLLVHTQSLTFLPALTPLQGIGIVEGVLDLSQSGRLALTQPQSANAFEAELTGISQTSGDKRGAARTAFYFKGAIKGEYLLTAAYDSDKAKNERLFRDIRPDEFYPVYGDGSVRGFDAQSSQRLYVRIDKNRSFLLYGDFLTTSSAEVRQLSQYSRALSGVQHRYQDEKVRATSFYAETNATQQVEELPANGLSFFSLNNVQGDIRGGTEKVDIVVRDRRQPQTVLSVRTLTRLVDYSFEPLTRRLYLVQPVPSYDSNLNPQSIRVTYELDSGGPAYKVMGTDVQMRVSDNAQLGAVVVQDQNPANRRDLHAATALVRLNDTTAASAEAVETVTDLKGRGRAARATVRHDGDSLKAQAQVVKTEAAFDSLSATSAAGRTEVTARADYALNGETRLLADAQGSRNDNPANGTPTSPLHSVSVAMLHKISDNLVGEAGVRHGNSAGTNAGGFDYSQVGSTGSPSSQLGSVGSLSSLGGASTNGSVNAAVSTTVRARLTGRLPDTPRAQIFGEVEQDVNAQQRHGVTIGGNYAVTDKTRVYAQHALVSSLADLASVNGQNLRNATVVGIDSAYMEGGRIYNEYRANTTAAPQNASGVRNTLQLNPQWRMNAGLEHVQTVGAAPASASATTSASAPTALTNTTSTTVALGVDYALSPWRMSSALERRYASVADAALFSLAGSWRVDDNMTLLARSISTNTHDNVGASNTLQRQQLGLAWRPAYADGWNVLSRLEHRFQNVTAASAITGGDLGSANSFGSATAAVGRTDTRIGSLHGNLQIDRNQQLSVHYAAKYTRLNDNVAPSTYWAQLVHGRYTRNLTTDWDAGVQVGRLWGKGGAHQDIFGLEVGYQLMPNLWLSAGYNVLGLSDPDLTSQNYTSRGAYLRLRFKFDEAAFQFGRVAAPTPDTPNAANTTPVTPR